MYHMDSKTLEEGLLKDVDEKMLGIERRRKEILVEIEHESNLEEMLKEMEELMRKEREQFEKELEKTWRGIDDKIQPRNAKELKSTKKNDTDEIVNDAKIAEKKLLLEADRLKIEKRLSEARINLRQMIEIIAIKKDNMDLATKIEKEIVEKHREVSDKQTKLTNDMQRTKLQTQSRMFTTLLTKSKMNNNKVINDFVEQLNAINDEITEAYFRCKAIMTANWNDEKKGIVALEKFSFLFNKARRQLTNTELRLMEIDDKGVADELSKSIRKMRHIIFLLDHCVANIRRLLMARDTTGYLEGENELSSLMTEFSQIKFTSVRSYNKEFEDNLRSSLPKFSEKEKIGH